MKHLLFLFLFIPLFAFSQMKGRVEFGYQNAIKYANEISGIANEYNTSRPWLKSEMKLANLHNGFSFGFYSEPGPFSFGFNMSYVWYSGKASGLDGSGVEFKRKLRSHLFTIDLLDMGYYFIQTDKLKIGLGMVPFSFTRGRVSTKLDDGEWKYATHISMLNDYKKSHWYAGFKFQAHAGFFISDELMMKLTIFYQLNYAGKMNLYYVDQDLNPRTVSNYLGSHLFSKPKYFGIRISLNLITD